MMRLGIYGGTFSPIHMGHVRAAHAFLETMELDKLLVIPTSVPPHKAEIVGATAADRLKMAQLALEDSAEYQNGRIEVSDYEMTRDGKSYTVYTLEHFAAPEVELFMLVGTDMFLTLARWYRAEDIFRLAHIVLMRRETDVDNAAKIEQKYREYTENFGARITMIPEPPLVVSSTELRERMQNGQSTDGFLPDRVARYIAENNLY